MEHLVDLPCNNLRRAPERARLVARAKAAHILGCITPSERSIQAVVIYAVFALVALIHTKDAFCARWRCHVAKGNSSRFIPCLAIFHHPCSCGCRDVIHQLGGCLFITIKPKLGMVTVEGAVDARIEGGQDEIGG
jgi:hypothetical protein